MAFVTAPVSFKLSADVLFSKLRTDGDYEGYTKIANCTAFALQPQSATDTILGTELDNYNQTLDAITQSDQFLVTMSCNRFEGLNLAYALFGTESEVTAGSENITSEVVMLRGGVGHLSRFDVSSVVVLGYDLTLDTDEADGFTDGEMLFNQTTGEEIGIVHSTPDGTSVYVLLTGTAPTAGDVVEDSESDDTGTIQALGVTVKNDIVAVTTDYTITAVNGRITVVDSGGLDWPLLDRIKVNYTSTKDAGSQIALAAESFIKGQLIVKGVNQVNSKQIEIYLRQVNLAPNAAIPFIGDDRSSVDFQGTAETPSGQTDPGWIRMR